MTIFIKNCQFWSNLIKFDQIWTNLSTLVDNSPTPQESLKSLIFIKIDQFCSNLIKIQQIFTKLMTLTKLLNFHRQSVETHITLKVAKTIKISRKWSNFIKNCSNLINFDQFWWFWSKWSILNKTQPYDQLYILKTTANQTSSNHECHENTIFMKSHDQQLPKSRKSRIDQHNPTYSIYILKTTTTRSSPNSKSVKIS